MKNLLVLSLFLITTLSFPLYEYSLDSMETLSANHCGSNSVTFSQEAPILGILTPKLWPLGFGALNPNIVCNRVFPFIFPYSLNYGYESVETYTSNAISGLSPIDQYIGNSFVSEEWGRVSFLNAIISGQTNQFQTIVATNFIESYCCFIYPNNIESGLSGGGLNSLGEFIGAAATYDQSKVFPESSFFGGTGSASLDGIKNGNPPATTKGLAEGLFCLKIDTTDSCLIEYECMSEYTEIVDDNCEHTNIVLELTNSCNGDIIESTNNAPSTYNIGVNIVTLGPTSLINNIDVATCTSTITLVDNTAPVITCPSDYIVNGFSCVGSHNQPATATDNCNNSPSISYSEPINSPVLPLGTTTITATANDENGNTISCTFDVTVIDIEDPVITCPADYNVNADSSCMGTHNRPATAIDNCDTSPSISYSEPINSPVLPLGATTITATVNDENGNTISCTFDVTVIDIEDPVITCPADYNVNADSSCMGTHNRPATAIDNCDTSPSISYSEPFNSPVLPLPATTITATINDESGNTISCTFDVTVIDIEDPVITCPADYIIDMHGVFQTEEANANDNCNPNPTISYSPSFSEALPLGTTTITATASDDSKNQNSCSFEVTVTEFYEFYEFHSPNEDTIWSLYQKGCIRIETGRIIGDIYLIYGIPWNNELLIQANVDLTSGEFEWDILGGYPSFAMIKILFSDSTIFYSDQFKIIAPSSHFTDEC